MRSMDGLPVLGWIHLPHRIEFYPVKQTTPLPGIPLARPQRGAGVYPLDNLVG